MAKTLLERAIDIRDEVTEYQNTAERVGSVLVEVVEGRELAQDTVDQLVAKQTDTESRVGEVESRTDDLLRDVTLHRQKNEQQDTDIAALKSIGDGLRDELVDQKMELTDHSELLSEHDSKLSMYPAQMMMDLGLVENQDAGLAMAARSEIAGNRNISFIRFQINGVSALRTTLILQWPNGMNETAQLVFTDKAQWRRNVSGATGNAGDTTTPTQLERTAPHYLGYDAATRKIQLKDYTQAVSRDVQLPVASRTTDGLLAKADYANLYNFLILEDNAQGADSVAVKYPNPVSGAQNKFYLLPASEARAGVMTAAIFQELKAATANIAEEKAVLDRLVAAAAEPDYVELTFESYDSYRRRKVLPNTDYFTYIEVDGQVLKSDTVTAESGELRLYMTGGRHVVRCRPVDWGQLYLFSGCDGLVEATLPAGVTGLPAKCFEQCTQLRRISLPDGLLTIGPWAFLCCNALEELTIPDTVTSIGTKCFELCTSLRKCTLGVALQTLAEYAFMSCTALAELTIHSEGLTLGGSGGTFPYCNKLAVIRCSAATPPTCESSNPFTDTTNVGRDVDAAQRKLYRPAGATGYTESTSKWKTGLIDMCGFTVVDAI